MLWKWETTRLSASYPSYQAPTCVYFVNALDRTYVDQQCPLDWGASGPGIGGNPNPGFPSAATCARRIFSEVPLAEFRVKGLRCRSPHRPHPLSSRRSSYSTKFPLSPALWPQLCPAVDRHLIGEPSGPDVDPPHSFGIGQKLCSVSLGGSHMALFHDRIGLGRKMVSSTDIMNRLEPGQAPFL